MDTNQLIEVLTFGLFGVELALVVRVIMRRRPVGVSFAWVFVIFGMPVFGVILYLLIGELRLGRKRAARAALVHGPYQEWLKAISDRDEVGWLKVAGPWEPLAKLADSAVGIPPLAGNNLELFAGAEECFTHLVADIDRAERTCHLEFYIWNPGGWADRVTEALIRAAQRGVRCRILLDAVGSRPFLKSAACAELRRHGVHVQAALQAGLVRALFVRFDLRLHRKIVVIDGEVGWAGSLNLVDPRYFKQDEGVGQWVDAMVRLRGPAVEALAVTFLEDWELDTGEGIEELMRTGDVHALADHGPAVVQVLPSGPVVHALTIQEVLLMLVWSARHEILLTTPYFVPDEPLQAALIAAARRGIKVTLIVPAKEDSLLVRFASQAYRGDLVAAGVQVKEFRGGLLHTKSVTVDGQVSLFGSLNLDPRSLFLNFEISLAVYDADFTHRLRQLQRSYLEHCVPLEWDEWSQRSRVRKFAQNTARLLGPLL